MVLAPGGVSTYLTNTSPIPNKQTKQMPGAGIIIRIGVQYVGIYSIV
jgi:hypothetical protein